MTHTKTARHIRARTPKRRGNQYYKDCSVPEAKTLCGDKPTTDDLGYNDYRGATVRQWYADHAGCANCARKWS